MTPEELDDRTARLLGTCFATLKLILDEIDPVRQPRIYFLATSAIEVYESFKSDLMAEAGLP